MKSAGYGTFSVQSAGRCTVFDACSRDSVRPDDCHGPFPDCLCAGLSLSRCHDNTGPAAGIFRMVSLPRPDALAVLHDRAASADGSDALPLTALSVTPGAMVMIRDS